MAAHSIPRPPLKTFRHLVGSGTGAIIGGALSGLKATKAFFDGIKKHRPENTGFAVNSGRTRRGHAIVRQKPCPSRWSEGNAESGALPRNTGNLDVPVGLVANLFDDIQAESVAINTTDSTVVPRKNSGQLFNWYANTGI